MTSQAPVRDDSRPEELIHAPQYGTPGISEGPNDNITGLEISTSEDDNHKQDQGDFEGDGGLRCPRARARLTGPMRRVAASTVS